MRYETFAKAFKSHLNHQSPKYPCITIESLGRDRAVQQKIQ